MLIRRKNTEISCTCAVMKQKNEVWCFGSDKAFKSSPWASTVTRHKLSPYPFLWHDKSIRKACVCLILPPHFHFCYPSEARPQLGARVFAAKCQLCFLRMHDLWNLTDILKTPCGKVELLVELIGISVGKGMREMGAHFMYNIVKRNKSSFPSKKMSEMNLSLC
jgi:hypothetical protein